MENLETSAMSLYLVSQKKTCLSHKQVLLYQKNWVQNKTNKFREVFYGTKARFFWGDILFLFRYCFLTYLVVIGRMCSIKCLVLPRVSRQQTVSWCLTPWHKVRVNPIPSSSTIDILTKILFPRLERSLSPKLAKASSLLVWPHLYWSQTQLVLSPPSVRPYLHWWHTLPLLLSRFVQPHLNELRTLLVLPPLSFTFGPNLPSLGTHSPNLVFLLSLCLSWCQVAFGHHLHPPLPPPPLPPPHLRLDCRRLKVTSGRRRWDTVCRLLVKTNPI